MKTEDYLKEGKFTKFDKTIEKTLNEIENLKIERNISGKISYYLTNIMRWNNPQNFGEFRQRTASEIIKSGYYNSCSDRGIVFVTLARKAGIPTKYVETLEEKNLLEKPEDLVSGHAFVEIFIEGRWRKYEPNNGFLKEGYSLGEDKYIEVGEGLDFSNLRLNNGKTINLNSIDKIRKLRDNDIKLRNRLLN